MRFFHWNKIKVTRRTVIVSLLAFLAMVSVVIAVNMSDTNKYAWGENVGWFNWNSTDSGVHVYEYHLEGYVWQENVGWINLACENDSSCGSTDFGVDNDGKGNLSGYAYSENAGWINFNPSDSQVTIDTDGYFHGYAWSENMGWINMNCTNNDSCADVDFKVQTTGWPEPPNDPTNLAQYEGDCSTSLGTGSWTNATTVCLKADVDDPNTNDKLKLSVDYGSSLDGAVDASSSKWFTEPATATTVITGLQHGTQYKWQGRALEDISLTSSWVTFNSGNVAFKVDTKSPTTTIDSPSASSWQNSDFDISMSDTDADSGVDTCTYAVDDGNDGSYGSWQSRTCNSSFSVSVGSGAECSIEGTDSCAVKVKATDVAGNVSTTSRAFSIDYTDPVLDNAIFTNDDYAPNWYDQESSATATMDVGWIEAHPDSVEINVLSTNYTDSTPGGGTSTFDISIDGEADGTHSVSYTMTDLAGNSTTVVSGTNDAPLGLDSTVPDCSLSSLFGTDAFYGNSATQGYYNNATTGSFTVEADVTDAGSGVQKIVFPDTTSAGGEDASSTYNHTYSWDTTDTYSAATSVTCYDNLDNSTTSNEFTITPDNTAPSGGSVTHPDQHLNTTSIDLTVSDGSDSDSGIDTNTRVIERRTATLSGGSCGSWGSWTDETSNLTQNHPDYTDNNVSSGNCYQYQYKIKDNVLNQQTYSTTSTTTIDTQPPSGGSIDYQDGFIATTTVDITLQDGSDASEIATTTRTLQRKSATLSDGNCGTYDSWSTIATSSDVGYNTHTDSSLSSNKCYKYQYLVSDEWGYTATYSTTSVLKVDTAAPTGLRPLAIEETGADWVKLSWSEVTEANFDRYEIWSGTSSTSTNNGTAPASKNEISEKSTTKATITGLVESTYYFKVWAIDVGGREATTTVKSAETTEMDTMQFDGVNMQGIQMY